MERAPAPLDETRRQERGPAERTRQKTRRPRASLDRTLDSHAKLDTMSLRRGVSQLLGLRQAGWPAVVGCFALCVCVREERLGAVLRAATPPPPQSAPHAPPAPPIARNRARPAATMPRRCVDRRRAWREGSKGRGKIVLASRSRYLQHTLASPPTRNEQPLRNEDDYTKFASDNERAHVNVSCFSFLRCEPHRPRTLAHTARAPDT